MKQYKFVETTIESFFTTANYQSIIQEHAKQGWKLIQVLPCKYNGHGKPTRHEIIFEMEIDDSYGDRYVD